LTPDLRMVAPADVAATVAATIAPCKRLITARQIKYDGWTVTVASHFGHVLEKDYTLVDNLQSACDCCEDTRETSYPPHPARCTRGATPR